MKSQQCPDPREPLIKGPLITASLRFCRASFDRQLPSGHSTAFTLTELLVAIVLVAILAVISVAGYQVSQRSARNVQCLHNLKQIGIGTQIYLTDNNNRFFPEEGSGPSDDRYGNWLRAIRKSLALPYTEVPGGVPQGPVEKIFICPAHPTKGGWVKHGAPTGRGITGDESTSGFIARSYVPNRYVLNLRVTEMPNPSQVILFVDYPWDNINARSFWRGDNWSNNLPTTWHQGMVNCLFVDLHIEPIKATSLRLWAANDRLWYPNYPDLPWAK